MARLQVNVDHVATVRQARRASEPDPVHAASIAELAGATGITIHLREDRRHIQDRDLRVLRETVKTCLNLEMAVTEEMTAIALAVRPDQVTLVPEKRRELTTEGGLDVVRYETIVAEHTRRLAAAGIAVSHFIDPDAAQSDAAKRAGAQAVEFHTGAYAEARGPAVERELERLKAAVSHARNIGLTVHLGHGLDYRNVKPVAAIPGIDELNIGFSIVARAVLVGFEKAVSEMVAAIAEASGEITRTDSSSAAGGRVGARRSK
jgi:pyridoxine 5-phosphate synthase